jgi:hypothetical protein
MNDQGIFVKIERNEEIQAIVTSIRQKTADAKMKLQKIRALDKEEEQKIEEFEENIAHIDANLDQVESFMKG